jgi:hypothetical protein
MEDTVTVSQLVETLAKFPPDAVVLMETDAGLSLVWAAEFLAALAEGAPAEVILLPSMAE